MFLFPVKIKALNAAGRKTRVKIKPRPPKPPKLEYESSDGDEPAAAATPKLTERELNKRVKDAMWPWVKTPFATVNNFDNRFKAQEKLLQEQNRMIRGKTGQTRLFLSSFFKNT
jgi:hypothetical protein